MAEGGEGKLTESRELPAPHHLCGAMADGNPRGTLGSLKVPDKIGHAQPTSSGRTGAGGVLYRHLGRSRAALVIALLLALGMISAPAHAQQESKIARIGFLAPATPDAAAVLVQAFRQGLQGLGYVEGKTFVLE